MARSNEIQYVRFYSYGSAAEKLTRPEKEKKKAVLPEAKPKQEHVWRVKMEPLAMTGLVLAGVMLVCMVIGLVQVGAANARLQQAQLLVAQLQLENDRLQDEYDRGYDLAEIRVSAEAMGLVSTDEVRHVTVKVPPQTKSEPELSWWAQWLQDFKALFAIPQTPSGS